MRKNIRGFTLIELIIVMGIIAVLAGLVLVALNPVKRFADSRDARRFSDVDNILAAISQSIVDNKGLLPSNMPAVNTEVQLGTATTGCAIATAGCAVGAASCVNLMTGTRNLTPYVKSLPIDPTGGTYDGARTGYSVVVDTNGIVTVRACGAENVATISASR